MTIDGGTTLSDLAFIVGTAFEQAGISAVLTGGGAATVYAPEANSSRDLDFVLSFWSALGASASCLKDLGFRAHRGTYIHPATAFTLEFPEGPLMIGSERILEWRTLRREEMALKILTPTDCVRDRLSWFLFYPNVDFSALEQALAVARRHQIDLDRIRSWANVEGAGDRFSVFESRFRNIGE